MAFTYEDVNPTLIANTTMQKMLLNDVHKTYTITPSEGYILHDKNYDEIHIDETTGEEILVLGFRTATATVAASYDFIANPREFYAILEDELPEGAVIYSSNNHEIA